jgi:DNA-binding NtrC family response regulator
MKAQDIPPSGIWVLVVDDEPDVREFFSTLLSREGYSVNSVSNGRAALDFLATNRPHVLLLDLRLPDMSGIEVLKKLKEMQSDTVAVVMTGYASVGTAVEAMKLGAWDYLVKPIEEISVIFTAVKGAALNSPHFASEGAPGISTGIEGRPAAPYPVGDSPEMGKVLELAAKAAEVDSSVLVCGESGTGKELVAKLIHYNCPRSKGKFLAVNCSAVPDTLLESTLFGYERGAFTGAYRRTKGYFEAADGGTLFLDEIADTSLPLQAKLLRALEEKAFQRVGGVDTVVTDVRIISATNKRLKEEVTRGNFREDLFYRINVLNIEIPPLRDRPQDIPALVSHFLSIHSRRMGRRTLGFSPESMEKLMSYSWPGNVRELENIVERALAFQLNGALIQPETLPLHVLEETTAAPETAPLLGSLANARQDFERDYLEALLDESNGNVQAAAATAGISRPHFYAKMRKYGLHTRRK